MDSGRHPSTETRQALFWALLAARCAGETNVTRNRVLIALLRTRSVAESCARARVAPGDVIEAVEDRQALSFEECARSILTDLAEQGLELGSRQHIASVRPLPLEPAVQAVMRSVLEQQGPAGERVGPLELLVALMRADPALAARLADHGLDAETLRREL